MQCSQCNTENRNSAKFCKYCGTNLAASKQEASLGISIDKLVGLDELKKELSVLQAILEGMKQNNTVVHFPYDTIIIGASGTAKTLISNLIAALFLNFGMITKGKPETVDGASLESMPVKDMEKLFSNAKGGMLFVYNAQKLVDSDGKALPVFSKFINVMDANDNDPIVLMAGLPAGLGEFIKSSESTNKQILNRFEKIFIIPDYTPDQYAAITGNELKKMGFTFNGEFSEKLLQRFRYLYKELKKPDNSVKSVNGYLAIKEAQTIAGCYYLRKASDKIILPEDIKGQVEEKKPLEEVMAELNAMTGMADVKKMVRELAENLKIQQERVEQKKAEASAKGEEYKSKVVIEERNNIVITGNPGTGKSTIVRTLAKLFNSIGIIPIDTIVECQGNDLKGSYVGQPKDKVNAYCDSAMGGILFIDEAYSLVNDQGPVDSYAKEAIDVLMARILNDGTKFITVIAGYEKEIGLFLDKSNPGMRRRFIHFIHLPDYTAEELLTIFVDFNAKNAGFSLSVDAHKEVRKLIQTMVSSKAPNFGNAGTILELFNSIKRRQASRLNKLSLEERREKLNLIEAEDIRDSEDRVLSIDEVLSELDAIVGMKEVKETVRGIANKLVHQKKIMDQTGKVPDGEGNNICITGNPGTGKTTIVRSLAKLFKAIGLLANDKPLEILGDDLKGSYVGQSKDKVNEYCRQAIGGVLFIDEAYNLVNERGPIDTYAQESITVLLAHLENNRDKFVCIVAGYPKEMDTFIKKSNPGMERRFKHYIHLPDYSADELIEIFERFNVQKAGYILTDKARKKAKEAIHLMVAKKSSTFGNAGAIRTFFEKVTGSTANRVSKLPEEQQLAVLQVIEEEDIP